jgi:hypothetical protein
MSRVPLYAFSIAAASAALAWPAYGQAVISTRAGLVHFFEGAVYVAGQPLEARLGKFTSIPEGAELRTEQGRAEVLLTPGVFLRVGEKSAIRMVASALSDTRVELLAGSAIVDSAPPVAGTSVTLIYKDWNVRQPQKGLYRIDGEPPRLQVREGAAEVSAAGGTPVPVEEGMALPLAAVLVPEKSPVDDDTFSDWAEGRAEAVSTDNAIAANIQDPASLAGFNLPADGFTYFPMLGLPMVGSSLSSLSSPYGLSSYQSGLYGSLYQPGFYSPYLPGYTYRPLYLRLPSSGLQRPLYPSYRGTLPGTPIQRPPSVRPVVTPPAGVHIGVRH